MSLQTTVLYNMRGPAGVCAGIDPPDALKERDGIHALQALELKVDHSVSKY